MNQLEDIQECDRCDKMTTSGVYSDVDDSFYCDDCAEYLDSRAIERLEEGEL